MNIIYLLILFGILDFIIHYPLFELHPSRRTGQDIYHILQFIVHASVPYLLFHFSLFTFHSMLWFYFLLLTGFCDMVYICIWWFLTNRPYTELPDWLWWSFPLGWYATIKASLEYRMMIKGIIKFSHFKIQVSAAIIIYFLYKLVIPYLIRVL